MRPSRALPTTDSRQIGRKASGLLVELLPDLGINLTIACLKIAGKTPRSKHLLKRRVISESRTDDVSLNTG